MFEVHLPTSWGSDGLEATTKLVEFSNAELAWEYVKLWYAEQGPSEILMVTNPGHIDHSRGHPSRWLGESDDVLVIYRQACINEGY